MSSPLVLDVSNANPIDERTLRRAGAAALIAKATEGSSYHDTSLYAHRVAAARADIPFGSYLFLHPSSPGSEAAAYLAYARPKPGDLQPIIDCEVTDGEPIAAVAHRCQTCAVALEHAGYRPLLYSSSSFLQGLYGAEPALRRLRVWEAAYPGRFTAWTPRLAGLRARVGGVTVCLWQWTDVYALAGRRFDASRLFVPLTSLLIPKGAT